MIFAAFCGGYILWTPFGFWASCPYCLYLKFKHGESPPSRLKKTIGLVVGLDRRQTVATHGLGLIYRFLSDKHARLGKTAGAVSTVPGSTRTITCGGSDNRPMSNTNYIELYTVRLLWSHLQRDFKPIMHNALVQRSHIDHLDQLSLQCNGLLEYLS